MRWFHDLATKYKLVLSFFMVTSLLTAVAMYCLSVAAKTNRALDETYHEHMAVLELAQRAQIERVTIARDYRSVMLEKTEDGRVKKLRQLEEADAKFKDTVAELDKSSTKPKERALMDDILRLTKDYGPAVRESMRIAKAEPEKALAALGASAKIGLQIAALLDQYVQVTKEETAALVKTGIEDYSNGRMLVIVMSTVAAALAVLVTFAVSTAIATPMHQAIAVLEKVAKGDLTARLEVDRKDEIGAMAKTMNASVESVRAALAGVAHVLVETTGASSQLAESAQEIASGAQNQAASLEETAASLEEISATVKLNTDNAQEASHIAQGARDVAERGGAVVEAAVAAMQEITKSSKQIADIITTIDEIAFQTNLLALNAAVEAARAGEQGRGFAVVAAEVRSLAQRTGSAAKEIRGLIADSSAKVEVGTHQVNESGKTLEELVRSVKKVTDMVAEIAAASREQTTGLDQVNQAVGQIDSVTQSNAAQTEQLSGTAAALSDKSVHLQSLIDAFRLGDEEQQQRFATAPRSAPSSSGRHPISAVVRTASAARPRLAAGGRRG